MKLIKKIETTTGIEFIGEAETTPEHNQLDGLQGGTTDEYYHLTATEQSNLHTHTNKTFLDSLLQFGTGAGDVAEGNHSHSDLHSHTNKTDLDNYDPDDFAAANHTHIGLPIEMESLDKTIDNEYIFYIKGTTNEIDLSDYNTPSAFRCNLKIIGLKNDNNILSSEYSFVAKRVGSNCSIANIIELDYYDEEGSGIFPNIEIVNTYILRIAIVSTELYKFSGLVTLIERTY